MLDFENGMKFCPLNGGKIKYKKQEYYRKVKGELVRKSNKKQKEDIPLVSIWRLYRYIGIREPDIYLFECYAFSTSDLGNGLNADWIALNLNVENCFDFEYTPSEGDYLRISQNIVPSSFISFIFKNGVWKIDDYAHDTVMLELINEGNVLELNTDF